MEDDDTGIHLRVSSKSSFPISSTKRSWSSLHRRLCLLTERKACYKHIKNLLSSGLQTDTDRSETENIDDAESEKFKKP